MGTYLTIHTPQGKGPGDVFERLEVDVTDVRNDHDGGFLSANLKVEDTTVTVYLHNDSQVGLFCMALRELASELSHLYIDPAVRKLRAELSDEEEDAMEHARGDFGDDAPVTLDTPEGATTGPWLRHDLPRYK